MSRFQVKDLPLGGLKLVQFQPSEDPRGSLTRMFCSANLRPFWPEPIRQINQTTTRLGGTIRGLHFQRPPHAEKKLVSCLRGEVWDVAVDLRAGSPTFLQWHAECLSAVNRRGMMIPEGFAHGFQTLTPDVEMLYFHSAAYCPDAEGGIRPLDPRLGIPWPRVISSISERDKAHALLDPGFAGMRL